MSKVDPTPEHQQEYIVGFREYLRRIQPSRSSFVAEFFLSRQAKFGLKKMEIFVSIGPAAGDVDVAALDAFPGCRSYIGLEKDESNAAQLRANMTRKFPEVQVTVVNCPAETWEGPNEQVDVIFMSHVLYNIPLLGDFLRKAVTWLKPGGLLVTLHGDDTVTWITSSLPSGAKIFKEIAYPYQSHLMNYLRELEDVNIVEVVDRNAVMDIESPNLHLANFFLMKECTEDEMNELFEHLKSYDTSGHGHLPVADTLTFLVKNL